MVKSRKDIPKATKESVLGEYNHRCAICGGDRPHIHHIDENPDNHDQLNLIPLCPNCHLTDQHDPTRPVEPERLSLFRKHKDPHILSSQFEPIFNRLRFLSAVDSDSNAVVLDSKSEELVEFINEMEMGSFYSKKIAELIRLDHAPVVAFADGSELIRRAVESNLQDYRDYLKQLVDNREEVYSLVVEILRYQDWKM